jgi:hypothetical protein
MKTFNTLIIIALASIFQIHSQKTLSELANYSDKKFKRATKMSITYPANLKAWRKMYKLKGGDANFKFELGKNIGLLTFFLTDYNKTNLKAMRNGGLVEKYLTQSGGKPIISNIYDETLPRLKKTVSTAGFNLLLPGNYTSKNENLNAYLNTNIEASKAGKFIKGWENYFAAAREVSPVAPSGYRVFPATLVLGGVDWKVQRQLGFLMDKVDVDGFISIQVITELKGEKVSLQGVKVALHGRNPMNDIKGVKYTGGYFSSFPYGGANLTLKKPIEFARISKKEFKEFNVEGFEKIINRLVQLVFADYKDKIQGI